MGEQFNAKSLTRQLMESEALADRLREQLDAARQALWQATNDEGAELVVMLAPANRTEQRWWQESIEPHRDRGGVLSTEFLPRRINFGSRDNLGAWSASSAPFGCVLLIWEQAGPAAGDGQP